MAGLTGEQDTQKELPQIVKELRDGRVASCQAAAVAVSSTT